LEAVRQYQLHLLHEKKLSPESINQFVSAVKFLYLNTLEMPWGQEQFPRVRRPSRLPVVLSLEEVAEFFEHIPSLKYRAALMSCYGAGLRVEQGKGQKDRYSMLSPRLLAVLRTYWRAQRPRYWLFPSWRQNQHLSAASLQTACREACKHCHIGKRITPHTLARRARRATALPRICWRTVPTFV
jgi:integrase/recombinase XerD